MSRTSSERTAGSRIVTIKGITISRWNVVIPWLREMFAKKFVIILRVFNTVSFKGDLWG